VRRNREPLAVDLKFERIFDDKEFEVWRIGAWEFTRWSGGKPFWRWVGVKHDEAAVRQPREVSGRDAAREIVERLRAAPHRYSLL
jgi:hypothetical protein